IRDAEWPERHHGPVAAHLRSSRLTAAILVRPAEPNRGMSMTVSRTLVATAAVTLLIGVSTAQAQHRGGGGQSRAGGGQSRAGGGQSRGGGGGQRAVARAPSGPRSGGAPRAAAPRSYANGPSRSGPSRVYSGPRAGVSAPRSYAYAGSRGYSGYRGGSRGGVVVGRTGRFYGGGRFVNVRPVRFY